MHMRGTLLILFIALLCMPRMFAQSDSPFRIGHCQVDTLIIRLDTFSIVPSSFKIAQLSPDQYSLDPIISTIYLKDSSLMGTTISYQYQTYQIDFSKPIFHKSLDLIERPSSLYVVSAETGPSAWPAFDDYPMSTSGSISRGVTVGNSQDLVLNSALNLQLSGFLTEDIQLLAVISDKNVPIQPEGNTQSIQNFNNVYIKLLYKLLFE